MSMDFDGTNDTITIGNVSALSFERTAPFTFSVWTNYNGAAAYSVVLAKIDLSDGYKGYSFQINGNLPEISLINSVPNSNYVYTTSDGNIATNGWSHVAVVYTGSSTAAGITFYINGAAQTKTTSLDALSATMVNSIDALAGIRPDGYCMNGLLDDLRVYNRALSAAEVLTLYSSRGADSIVHGLNARYRLDEAGSGSASGAGQQKDISANKNNGTPSNSPTYAESVIKKRRRIA